MTLAEKYNEAMNRLALSDEARQRILGNIQEMDLNVSKRSKVVEFPQWRRYAAIAACAAVVLLAAVTLNPRANTEPDEQLGSVTVTNGIVELADAQELSEALGFPVPELSGLPFPVTETTYASYWGELAQISYAGEEQTVTLRVQPGNEDVSGDYNNYAEVSTVAINGCDVTLKGAGGTVSTAIWIDGGYSFAITADVPISADAMGALVAGIRISP